MNQPNLFPKQSAYLYFCLFCLLSPFMAHAMQPINPAVVIFGAIFLVAVGIINIAYPFLAFSYALNAHAFSEQAHQKRKIMLGIGLVANLFAAMSILVNGFHLLAGAIFILIPFLFFILGLQKAKRFVFTKILLAVYIINILLFVVGGYDNPHGYGPKHGSYTKYFGNKKETVLRIENYRFGMLHGDYKQFMGDHLWKEGTYHYGKKDGYWKIYNFDRLEKEGAYKNDKKTGTWKIYSFGKLVEEIDY